MKKWTVWIRNHRRYILMPLVLILFVGVIRAAIPTALSGGQCACAVLWLLAWAVLMINNHRNEVVKHTAQAIFDGSAAVFIFMIDRNVVFRVISSGFMLVAFVSMLCAVQAYIESRKSHSDLDGPCRVLAGIDAKSNG
jgi:hypothetical protein